MRKIQVITAVLLSLSLASYSMESYAGPNHHKHQRDGERHGPNKKLNMKRVMKHYSQLDLSEAQTNSIKKIVTEGFQQSKLKRQEIRTLGQQLKNIKSSETVDEQALRAVGIEIANLKSDIMVMHINRRKQADSVLTEQQLVELNELRAERKQRRLEKN